MKLLLFIPFLLLDTCKSNKEVDANGVIRKTGIILIDYSRNHDSFDLFIPCKINDTLTLVENLRNIKPGVAINFSQYDLAFDIKRSGQVVTDQELNPKGRIARRLQVVCAADIAYREDYSFSNKGNIYKSYIKIGGIPVADYCKPNPINRVLSIKHYLLPRNLVYVDPNSPPP
ncbi:hypothetical protein [Hymenobacter lapidiphilus]|uniref:hypothetical protein n=1 Tax=Hymenobacter sp. CCM 8763 TaxID=2303334 RepID=UPI0011C11434|nr:hypothetical protein [Hymenobacter sp. CCM 8763]